MVQELATALALILVIEGVLYSLFPNAMKRMLEHVATVSPQSLRIGGLFFAVLGVLIVWMLRG
jgi:uncharacterized protein YjeT (DUF2065 family)